MSRAKPMGLKVDQTNIMYPLSVNALPSISYGRLQVVRGVVFASKEIEVLACLAAKRKVNKQIAFILSIAEKAVQVHLENIFKKTKCHSKRQIMEWLEQADEEQKLIDLYNRVLVPEASLTPQQKKRFLAKGIVNRGDKKKPSHWYMDLLRQGKSQLIIGLFLCVTSVLSLYLTFRRHEEIPLQAPKESIGSTQVICPSLIIPVESTLLLRPKVVKQIENKLQEQSKPPTEPSIPTLALVGIVGMGGVGKTTLARYYALTHKYPLIWELNAETRESLIDSFKDLAKALVKTKAEKEQFSLIQSIKNSGQKEKALVNFVKNLLQRFQNWLLIYDNVETLTAIKPYFPDDSEVWGKGKVIITTRNSNIANTPHIKVDQVLELRELTENEALTLFCKILYNHDSTKLSSLEQSRIKECLKGIPFFFL